MSARTSWIWRWLPRLAGLFLLGFLLYRLDLRNIIQAYSQANAVLVGFAVLLILVLIAIKTVRWLIILNTLAIAMTWQDALLAYFASLFIGFLTPGRLGEFGRALYVGREREIQPGVAFSSVLADRLFDLYALLIVGASALLALGRDKLHAALSIIAIAAVSIPFVLFLNDRFFAWLQIVGIRIGGWVNRTFAEGGWVVGMRAGLKTLSGPWLLSCVMVTVLSYVVFFGQCYLLALALDIHIDFFMVAHAVSLGSLITLLPFSISGLGTREAAIIAYLSASGVQPEVALSFSLLVFATFYIAGGLMGAVAWWIKPIPLRTDTGSRE